MSTKSEKELYGQRLGDLAAKGPNVEVFVWGEDLADKKLIPYPGKFKRTKTYQKAAGGWIRCGLVLVDIGYAGFLRCIPAKLDQVSGNVYIAEANFNLAWRTFRKSVLTGMRIAKEREETTGVNAALKPEDIVVLGYLEQGGNLPYISGGKIKYKKKELTDEERYKNSRKQSLLDNQKMLYFYSDTGEYIHDRECPAVKNITSEHFRAAEEVPEGKEFCPKCCRMLFIRKACYPNAKQIPMCSRILEVHQIKSYKLRRFVMESGLKFHATALDELQVTGAEDSWKITGLTGDELVLWHNNYVKVSPAERYITEGYHDQRVNGKTLLQLLFYIEGYSWEKHLSGEAQKEKEEELVAAAMKQEINRTAEPEEIKHEEEHKAEITEKRKQSAEMVDTEQNGQTETKQPESWYRKWIAWLKRVLCR